MYKIEKNVPVPSKRRGSSGVKYPLREMEIGDSFFAQCDESDKRRVMQNIAASARAKRLAPKKFAIRTVENGIRCWRIE